MVSTTMKFVFLAIAMTTCNVVLCQSKHHVNWIESEKGLQYVISSDEEGNDVKLSGILGVGLNAKELLDEGVLNWQFNEATEEIIITWESNNTALEITDCIYLQSENTTWFAGPERHVQVWPVNRMVIEDKPWVLSHLDNFAVIEPYWLNSNGIYLHVDPRSSLYVDQNNQENDTLCFIGRVNGSYINRDRLLLSYAVGVADNPKDAHLLAVERRLGKPSGHPNEKMIREPIWTTWAKYKAPINDDIVLDFAKDVVSHGYSGQLEIDDNWEKCYGAQEFSTENFPNINETVKALHDMNFRVTLWVHPFVNNDCEPNRQNGLDNGYFVTNTEGLANATWWDSQTNQAHQIDFTNEEARKWYKARLDKIKELHGIDSFKFDAGETDYVNELAVYPNVDLELVPNIHSTYYVRLCAELGDLVEVRSSWKTQDLPIFVRMLDKDSHWGTDNGLKSLVTTLLQMNLNGYVLVLPDMIGGNGYNGDPDAELIVRWTQANVFMPSMQFSYLPWDITSDEFDGEAIVKKFVDLHTQYADAVIAAMDRSIQDGTPVNPPIWWVDPNNREAHEVADEYLLGEDILVAPVVEAGATSRNVVLPAGTWKDGNSDEIHEGPKVIENYPAPIDVLPYFIRQN